MRLLLDCSVILLVVGGAYFWKHRPVPYVIRENSGDGQAPLGGEPAVNVTAGRVRKSLPNERSPWTDRLRGPWAVGAVVALFLLLFAGLASY